MCAVGKMMRGSSKGGRRRPFRCLPHTLGLLLFMAYWTAAFSAVLATGQTQVASNEMRKGGQQQIGVGGGPPGITVAMSPGLPSSSCQLALASLKVHLLSSYLPHIFCCTQFVPLLEQCHQVQCIYQRICVPLRVANCTLSAMMGVVEVECGALGKE